MNYQQDREDTWIAGVVTRPTTIATNSRRGTRRTNSARRVMRRGSFVEYASSETAYGRTVGYDFAIKVF